MGNDSMKDIWKNRNETDENRWYSYWLCSIPGVGNRTIERLLTLCESPKAVYYASDEVWEAAGKKKFAEVAKIHREIWDLEGKYRSMQEAGIRFLLQEDKEYPNRLREIPDAPFALFVMGEVPKEERLSVAVIGARECSEYGRYVAGELGHCLGENGVQVISGMARGIDGISQEAALQAGGVSFGVLGCGVDICYPKQNRKLYDRLLEQGGILSEYVPGTIPRPQNFPPRNRIVSGLADAVVVIEARNKSGTLITVDMALEQGREVYVVPGRITDRLSDGCNKLIKQGAEIFLSPTEFLDEILKEDAERRGYAEAEVSVGKEGESVCQNEERRTESGLIQILPPKLREVYKVLDFYPQSAEQILSKLSGHYAIVELNLLLMHLCMENYAVQVSPGHFCVKH